MEELGMGKIFQSISETLAAGYSHGTDGSGKSTTLAAMLDYINSSRYQHILTVEDPIEFVHESESVLLINVKSIVLV